MDLEALRINVGIKTTPDLMPRIPHGLNRPL